MNVIRSSNLKYVPKNLLLSKDQAIKTLINEVIQVNQNRHYKHYIIHDNNFTRNLKTKKMIINTLKFINKKKY